MSSHLKKPQTYFLNYNIYEMQLPRLTVGSKIVQKPQKNSRTIIDAGTNQISSTMCWIWCRQSQEYQSCSAPSQLQSFVPLICSAILSTIRCNITFISFHLARQAQNHYFIIPIKIQFVGLNELTFLIGCFNIIIFFNL